MASEARIYELCDNDTGNSSFVKATNQPQAIRHVARNKFSIKVASSIEVADHMTNGGKIIDATGPQKELPMED